jgi:hypothetical protein
MGLPVIFSEIQIPALRNRGIRVGGAMNADMAVSFCPENSVHDFEACEYHNMDEEGLSKFLAAPMTGGA